MSAILGIPDTFLSDVNDKDHEILPLMDGGEVFPSIFDDLKQAEEFIYICTWRMSGDFLISRNPNKKLTEFCGEMLASKPDLKIYILLWNILSFPGTWNFNFADPDHGNRLFIREHSNLLIGSHHQKFILADIDPPNATQRRGSVLHCLSLNLANAYWDTQDHPHPITHQNSEHRHETGIRVLGPLVTKFEEEFKRRWDLAGIGQALPLNRFIPTRTGSNYATPLLKEARQSNNPIYSWYRDRSKRISKFFYFEGQYFNHTFFRRLIANKFLSGELNNAPIRGAINLPDMGDIEFHSNDSTFRELRFLRISTAKKFKTRKKDVEIVRPIGGWASISEVRERVFFWRKKIRLANRSGEEFFWDKIESIEGGVDLYKTVAKDSSIKSVYNHSKLAIMDNEYTIGSCNLSPQSFYADSEANVKVVGKEEVSDLIRKLFTPFIKSNSQPQNIDEWFDAMKITAKENKDHLKVGRMVDGLLYPQPNDFEGKKEQK